MGSRHLPVWRSVRGIKGRGRGSPRPARRRCQGGRGRDGIGTRLTRCSTAPGRPDRRRAIGRRDGRAGFSGRRWSRPFSTGSRRRRPSASRAPTHSNLAGLRWARRRRRPRRWVARRGLRGLVSFSRRRALPVLARSTPATSTASTSMGPATCLSGARRRRASVCLHELGRHARPRPRRDRGPADETEPARIDHLFGWYKQSKYVAEHEVLRAAVEGLPVTLVLPTTPLGPGDRGPTPTGRIVVEFLNGRMPGWYDTTLNVVDVDDVATGHLLAAERGTIGRSYVSEARTCAARGARPNSPG